MMEFDAYPAVWTASLQRGNNELLLKLCRDEGEWRFSLKVTDPSGAKIPGMGFRARNSATMSPAGDVPPAVQMVNGFRHILRSPHALPVDGDYRGDSPGWKEHLYDGDGAVVWETDAVPRRAPTAFAFTASVSEMPGEAELWVDGRYALRFDTGRLTTARRWQEGAYVLDYSPQERGHNLSGHWVLQVPEEVVKPGDTVQLRVAHVDGSPHAFFMIKDRPDTAAFEGLAPGGDGSKRNVE
jgi:hypothetical protein